MHRVFIDGISSGHAAAGAEEAHHMKRVLRLAPGETVELLDGKGGLWSGVIRALEDGGANIEITGVLHNREPRLRVTLYQGVARGERMDLTVQKCTEIGVHNIVCVHMARSVSEASGKRARFERIAREAAKQCGRSLVPAIDICGFREALALMKQEALLLMPWEEGGAPVGQAACGMRDSVGLIIGPEGGIDGEEARALMDIGARAVKLGPRILRTETAGPVALALLLHLSGDMGGGTS